MATQSHAVSSSAVPDPAHLDPGQFTQEMDSSTIAQFLHQLATDPANSFNIHPRVVAFNSQASKENYIARQTTPAMVAEYKGCDRIQGLKGSIRAAGTIVWMSGSQFHIGDKRGSDLWHAYVVVYCNREIVIIDPKYRGDEGKKKRVSEFRGLGLVTALLPYIYTSKKNVVTGTTRGWGRPIDRIRIGSTGFGMPGELNCTEMSGRWLESFVHAGCPMS
ncbi:hypothetical protein L211DRAFT_854520 [Terfezia boudieri ATCC MYA-4762]|uniref:Uncharacterized protein n=1 Tax=Terfezia boudieri ATCC MYA-4762 TaxID=1051890 RepID=A0A3N4L660_9PEZI|nr:hypothetical protein L211DRAFT_854520 [Terfezia boudieri ATCC MYA-4762]